MFFSRSYSPPAGKGEGEKILFISYSALGDILLATPYARALKEKYPKCRLTWLAACPYEQVLEGQPYIDRVLQWDRRQDNTAFFRLIGEIRKNRYTRIVSLHNSDRGGIMALFSGVPQRYCRSDRWRAVYNSGNESFWKIHDIPVPETAGKGFVATEKMLESASAVLEPLKPPFVLAAIGASKEVKQWPVRNWVEFAKKACRRGIPVVLAGDGAGEMKISMPGLSRPSMDPELLVCTVTGWPRSSAWIRNRFSRPRKVAVQLCGEKFSIRIFGVAFLSYS